MTQPTDAGDRCPKCGDDSCLIEGSDRCRIRELTTELSRLRERNAVLERAGQVLEGIVDNFIHFDLPCGARLLHVCDEDMKECWKIIYPSRPRGPQRHPSEYYPTVIEALAALDHPAPQKTENDDE